MTKEEWHLYRLNHAESLAESQHKYYEKNKEKIKAKNKEYAKQRRLKLGMKPRQINTKSKCDECIYFLNKKTGIRGGIKGMCILSRKDRYWYETCKLLRQTREACKKFERLTR